MEKLPGKCPNCGDDLHITTLECGECGTKITGLFSTNIFGTLTDDEFQFVLAFLKARGNIKQVEKELGISYPTVRSRLDVILEKLNLRKSDAGKVDRLDILRKVEEGEITVETAVRLLKN